ncbi:16S rRNA (guanine(966)-N(2))-methyltransferase RsmD [Arthrobacter russicus]|uniref:16S rRNA (Guanine966-N2)-methyltransferase n=1 Tax=Arthrobacter russicus TaxID=172040 RepID=A0ABU1J752_9MICC|nr:16S rRNA (guanine(966)-N(2))-methyltransferase RsmD [Arthrobacter russicus]MDR6268257.1 16S rRNA (guanine966-N2)-methyltransferase [Arthrobacter russicus]
MSRIIAGLAGGHALASVPGSGTRPTTDRVKEALFSRLEAMDVLTGARVLDLYAGSGALGLESLSRGASSAELVEADAKAAAICQRNAELLNCLAGPGAARVNRAKVEQFLQRSAGPWDLVFLDPPYPLEESGLSSVLETLAPRLAAGAVVVVERSVRSPEPDWPAGLASFSHRSYGETRLWFAEPAVAEGASVND